MLEETDENKKQTKTEDAAEFDILGPDDFLNSVSVIDIFAETALKWLKKLENSADLVDTLEDFRVIRRHTKALKIRMRIASREALGNHTALETKLRHAMLLKNIRRTLKRMRLLKQVPPPSPTKENAE